MGRKGQATRDKLLEVAEQSILQKGFAGTSIDDVIREVGITKGGFFYHFDSKDHLAVALLEQFGLQGQWPRTKCILLAGENPEANRLAFQAADSLGAGRTLAKPFATEVLLSAIREEPASN